MGKVADFIAKPLKNGVNVVKGLFVGSESAIIANNTVVLGIARIPASELGAFDFDDPYFNAGFHTGALIGDIHTLVQGGGELLAAGVGEALTGGGATPIAIPVAAHGTAVTVVSAANIAADLLALQRLVMMKGERNRTSRPDGTDNPFKKMKPDPKDPKKVIMKDQYGKTIRKAKPEGFDEFWNEKNK